jgi:hypothetical protein
MLGLCLLRDNWIKNSSTEVGKYSKGGGGKGDSKGFVAELCDCGWHIHPSGGGDEECSSSS